MKSLHPSSTGSVQCSGCTLLIRTCSALLGACAPRTDIGHLNVRKTLLVGVFGKQPCRRNFGYRPHRVYRVYQRGCTSLHAIRATFFASFMQHPLFHTAHPKDIPPHQPTLPPTTHDQLGRSSRAFHSSHRNKSSNQAVPADHLRAQPWRGIILNCMAGIGARNAQLR